MQGNIAYRLAAVDLDDTLLGPDKRISSENRRAVQTLRSLGIKVVLASGRRHENMIAFHEDLGLDGFLVSSQGALVKHGETGEVIHSHFVPAGLAAEVVNETMETGGTLVYYHADGAFVSEQNVFTDLYVERAATNVVVVGDLRELSGYSPQKIVLVASPAQVMETFPVIHARYNGRLETLISEPEYIEFMAHGVTKAAGLAVVAERYGIAPSQTLAFGDGNNDVSMLKWAGLGIAMPHGQLSAKESANHVAPAGDPGTSFARAVGLAVELADRTKAVVTC